MTSPKPEIYPFTPCPRKFFLSVDQEKKLDEVFNRFANREVLLSDEGNSNAPFGDNSSYWVSPKDKTIAEFKEALKEIGLSLRVMDRFPTTPHGVFKTHYEGEDPNRVNIDLSHEVLNSLLSTAGPRAVIVKDFFIG